MGLNTGNADAWLVRSLVDQGILTEEQIVGNGLTVQNHSRRNVNFVVGDGEGNPLFFCKMGLDDLGRSSVASESRRYDQLMALHQAGSGRAALEPVTSDSQGSLLVLPFVKGPSYADGLGSFPEDEVGRRFDILGQALRALHELPSISGLVHSVPWGLRLSQPRLEDVESFSSGAVAALGVIHAQPALLELLRMAQAAWSPTSPIHGDMRLENCISDGDAARIVDWELMDLGQPEWDVAFLWVSALTIWVRSLPDVRSDADIPEATLNSAIPLPAVQLAMTSSWLGYSRELPPARASEMRDAALRFVASGLAQTAIESCQHSPRLTRSAVLLVQLAVNLAQRRDATAKLVFGDRWPLVRSPIRASHA